MKKVYVIFGIVILICANIFLYGFVAPYQEKIYFTIYAKNQIINVTDDLLKSEWYNYDSQQKFRNGKSLYTRAEKATSIKKDFPEIWQLILKLKRNIEVKPYDGHVVFVPDVGDNRRFKVVGGHSGYDLDEDRFCKDILSALKNREHRNIVAQIKEVKPKNEKSILAKIGLRAGYTTYFTENPAREHNIALSLGCFNGMTIQNGETVSFNKVVGKRTAERGYREAKIILDGEFVPGVGGGVCQSSTTLFNAVLLAGLKVDKSHNHSLAISYVPIGRDAMVSSAADLIFTNNSGGPIYIETGIVNATMEKSGRAYVRIYGNNTNIKYKPRTAVTESELKENEIDPARKAITYIDAWAGDRLVNSKLVRKSNYRAQKGKTEKIIEVIDKNEKPI